MHRELVEKRRWISDGRFLHALNYCMVLPGPEVQALLYGIKPALLAIVLAACIRLGQRVLRGPFYWAIAIGALCGLLLGFSFIAIISAAAFLGWLTHFLSKTPLQGLEVYSGSRNTGQATDKKIQDEGYVIDDHSPSPKSDRTDGYHMAVAIGAGIALWALLYSAVYQLAPYMLSDMAMFFTKAALVTFGGAYAVLPYVFDSAVNEYQWVSAAQMMDGLALGETTPGPLVMINAFVGFVDAAQHTSLTFLPISGAGTLGALVATVFTFLPSLVFILVGAPWIEATRKNLSLAAPLTAISAAVVGVIVDLALIFAQHTFFPDGQLWSWRSLVLVAICITVLAGLMLLQFKLGMLTTLLISTALGVVTVALQLP